MEQCGEVEVMNRPSCFGDHWRPGAPCKTCLYEDGCMERTDRMGNFVDIAICQIWKYRSTDLGDVSILIAGFNDSTVVAKVLNSDLNGHQVILPRSRFEGRTDYTVADPEPIEKERKMTQAEKWLNTYNPGQWVDLVKTITFEDGTRVEWDGSGYRLAPTFRKSEPDLGRKLDQDKPRWSLLPLHTIAQVIKVLEHGARKYSVGNWEHVPDARTRYYDAAMRHVEAWWTGEKNDPESGLPHLAHATACCLFLMWFDRNDELVEKANVMELERADALADVMQRRGV